MSEERRKPPTSRCDDALPSMPAEPAQAEAPPAPDALWRRLIEAASAAGMPIARLVPEQADAMVQRGLAPRISLRLLHGYPATPLSMGTLTFFPPLAQLGAARRLPGLFFIAEAWAGEHVFKRRLRSSLADMEEPEELSPEQLERALLVVAADYLEAIGTKAATAQDAGHRFWLPGAEAKIRETSESPPRVFALLGPLMAWDDFQAELERRLMVGRLWALLGVGAAVLALARNGDLSSRLLLAFGAFGILGGGLGVGPWMRATKRLQELLAARIGE